MNPDTYQRVMAVFDSVIECEPGAREAIIAQACRDDERLRREVEQLLAHYERADDFIEESPLKTGLLRRDAEKEDSIVGKRIGPYRIACKIGHGGMGAVYRAVRDDDEYHKQVAIKLIKRGMDTDELLRRFRNERQILANLDHPNIARLIDGGTTVDGLPYFVMEYVEGEPIDVYCDARKLSTIERLKLFRTVCSAVQYAHQNLIIHRDLKPNNILINDEGVPKLLDFGIAKLLHADLSAQASNGTMTDLRVMTPEYASPEQVKGEQITTASDVYSLGVLLYELLTGHRPYRLKSRGLERVAQAVCEQVPEKPSTAISRVEEATTSGGMRPHKLTPQQVSATRDGEPEKLRRRLRGDIDNIVLMAMRKERARRYASAGQFSEDIRRHLEGLPVIARKDTFSYRSSKFIKRHKVGVAAAAVAVLALFTGIVMTTREAQRANRRFNDVRKLAHSVLFDYHDAIANLPGSTPVRERLVKDALEYLDSLAKEASGDSSLQQELASAYLRVGDVQGKPYRANLGDTAGALASYRKAQAILERLSAAEPSNRDVRRDLSITYQSIGTIQVRTADWDGAKESERKAVALGEALVAADPSNTEYRRLLSDDYSNLGKAVYQSTRSETVEDYYAALESFRKSLSIREALAAADPKDENLRRLIAQSYAYIGYALERIGDLKSEPENYPLALESHRKTQEIYESLIASDPLNAQYQRLIADGINDVGGAQMKLGDIAGALEGYRKALSIFEKLAAADPTNVEARRDIANTHGNISQALAKKGEAGAALEHSRKASAIFNALCKADPSSTEDRAYLIQTLETIGELSNKKGNAAGALSSYYKALEILGTWLATEPTNTTARRLLATECANIGKLYTLMAEGENTHDSKWQMDWNAAHAWYQQSLNAWQEVREQGTLSSADAARVDEIQRELANSENALAQR